MSPNVITAIKDLWACAATTHNLQGSKRIMGFKFPPLVRSVK